MYTYPHRCTIERHVSTLHEGRAREELIQVATDVPCFMDETPVTAGLTSRQRSDATMISSETEALVMLPPQTDIRVYDRVTVDGTVWEVQYIRRGYGLRGVDHLEAHVITAKNR